MTSPTNPNGFPSQPRKRIQEFKNWQDIQRFLRQEDIPIQNLHALWENRHRIAPPSKEAEAMAAATGLSWLELNHELASHFCRHAVAGQEFLLAINTSAAILKSQPANSDSVVNLRLSHAEAMIRLGFGHTAWGILAPCLRPESMAQLKPRLKSRILTVLGHSIYEEAEELLMGERDRRQRPASAADAAARPERGKMPAAASDQASNAADAPVPPMQLGAYPAHPSVSNKDSRKVLLIQAVDYYLSALEADATNLTARTHHALISGELSLMIPGWKTKATDAARRILELEPAEKELERRRRQLSIARALATGLVGETQEAMDQFGGLGSIQNITTPELAEARHFARRLAPISGQSTNHFDKAFPPLDLLVFSGHLPDLQDDPCRFPADKIGEVSQSILAKLQELKPRVGLASGCAGGDLLFIQAMETLEANYHLVLPWARADFKRAAVEPHDKLANGLWSELFERALENATTIRELGQSYAPAIDLGWEYMMEVSAGIALNIARVSRLEVQPIVLWDGKPGRGPGGTRAFVEFWKRRTDRKVEEEKLSYGSDVVSTSGESSASQRIEKITTQHQVKTMLFADIVGYSKLSEGVIPQFVSLFLGQVSRLISTTKHAPCSVNTWGDSIYAVFDFARQAGAFALELTALIRNHQHDWEESGLYAETRIAGEATIFRKTLDLRIGLHSGPVFMHFDPVVRRLGYTGSHVNRAARIEPVSEPGSVFVSEEFAALLELEMNRSRTENPSGPVLAEMSRLRCEYAGSMQLAKGYPGWFHLYRLVPARGDHLELMAQACHEDYLRENVNETNPMYSSPGLTEWQSLTDDLRDSNRALAADHKIKLFRLGYEIVTEGGIKADKIRFSDDQIEVEAILEHERWMRDRIRNGWTYAEKRDDSKKHHNLLVPWEKLDETQKLKDRKVIRNLPKLIDEAGLRLRRID